MGWSSGFRLGQSIYDEIEKYIPDDKKREVAQKIISLFEDFDCDTMSDARKLYLTAYPEAENDEEFGL